MHIPDGVFESPVIVSTSVLGALGLAYACSRLGDQLRERTIALMGSTAAFIFAAQMVNFPLFPLPISGHLLGGVLAAVLLGPWAGAGVIAAVLLVQCLLFQDGGLTALGANFLNMGLIGSVGGYAIYSPIQRAFGGRKGVLIGAMLASWFAVILASGAFAIELAASGNRADFFRVFGLITLVHAGIGLGEAIITGLVLRVILQTRPDLIGDSVESPARGIKSWGKVALGGFAVAAAVAIFLAPFASSEKDGLEYVGTAMSFLNEEAPAVVASPIPGYAMPGLQNYEGLATATAGLVGTAIVFLAGVSMASVFTSTVTKVALDEV